LADGGDGRSSLAAAIDHPDVDVGRQFQTTIARPDRIKGPLFPVDFIHYKGQYLREFACRRRVAAEIEKPKPRCCSRPSSLLLVSSDAKRRSRCYTYVDLRPREIPFNQPVPRFQKNPWVSQCRAGSPLSIQRENGECGEKKKVPRGYVHIKTRNPKKIATVFTQGVQTTESIVLRPFSTSSQQLQSQPYSSTAPVMDRVATVPRPLVDTAQHETPLERIHNVGSDDGKKRTTRSG